MPMDLSGEQAERQAGTAEVAVLDRGVLDAGCVDIALGGAGDTPSSSAPLSGPSASKLGREWESEDTDDAGTAQASAEAADAAEAAEARSARRTAEAKRIQAARRVSMVSLVISAVAAMLGFSVGLADAALSLVGFGMEAALDGVSSALVLWRFKLPKEREHKDDESALRFREARDARRERNSGIGIGATFLFSAVVLYVSGFYKLIAWEANSAEHVLEEEDGANFGMLISLPFAVIFGALAVWKLRLAKALRSQVLYKDGLCSVLGAVLALICFVTAVLEEVSGSPETMARVDAVASGLIATILCVEGSRTLWHNVGNTWALEHRPMST